MKSIYSLPQPAYLLSICLCLIPRLAFGEGIDEPKDPKPSQIAAPSGDPYARFLQYSPKGFNIRLPGPANYIDRDPGGFRSKLADIGIGYMGWTNTSLSYDFRNQGEIRGSQVYAGQKETLTSYNFLFLTYDLGKIGIKGGQLTLGGTYTYVNWNAIGPTALNVGEIKYYQSLFNNRVELTAGYLGNSFVYTGIYIGGNLAGGTFGFNSNIPSQTGQSNTTKARPGLNVKVHIGGGFYNIVGVQRSINPKGVLMEREVNPSGLGWAGDNVGTLFLEELGYRRAAAQGAPETWIRVGGSYNTSGYTSLKSPGKAEHNYSLLFLADRQLLQFGSVGMGASRGLYGGVSVMYAPPSVNRFSQYYETRAYIRGPFASRPFDMISLVATQNRFGKYSVRNAEANGGYAAEQTTSISLGYTANVFHGVFVTAGASYVDNPRAVTATSDQKSALTGTAILFVYF